MKTKISSMIETAPVGNDLRSARGASGSQTENVTKEELGKAPPTDPKIASTQPVPVTAGSTWHEGSVAFFHTPATPPSDEKSAPQPRITYTVKDAAFAQLGNWAGPRELFPLIEVEQATAHVRITYYSISNGHRGQWGRTHEHAEMLSNDGQVLRITGMTGLRNDRRRTGGRQQFCFFVFRGDSGHLYTHRAVASKGWLECPPERLLARLRKVGIGAEAGVIQQGDFLLKPANGNAYPLDSFRHETMGAGHHKFAAPVLYANGDKGRQYLIVEPMTLCHEAVDGIKHPDVTVPPGVWIVGTTSVGLQHDNRRD